MISKFLKLIFGSKNERELKRMRKIVKQINALAEETAALTDEQLRARTDEFKRRLSTGETVDQILAEAFAVVREAGERTVGMRHFDVQLIGGITLHEGKIAEMRTGEGKPFPVRRNGTRLPYGSQDSMQPTDHGWASSFEQLRTDVAHTRCLSALQPCYSPPSCWRVFFLPGGGCCSFLVVVNLPFWRWVLFLPGGGCCSFLSMGVVPS